MWSHGEHWRRARLRQRSNSPNITPCFFPCSCIRRHSPLSHMRCSTKQTRTQAGRQAAAQSSERTRPLPPASLRASCPHPRHDPLALLRPRAKSVAALTVDEREGLVLHTCKLRNNEQLCSGQLGGVVSHRFLLNVCIRFKRTHSTRSPHEDFPPWSGAEIVHGSACGTAGTSLLLRV